MAKNHIKQLPEDVLNALDAETLALLKVDGKGINFNNPYGCQLTAIASNVTHRLYFNYNKLGGILSCVKHVIAVSDLLKERAIKRQVNLKRHTKRGGVCFARCMKSGGEEYYHYVRYKCPVRDKFVNRVFTHGCWEPTPGQWLHGQHTAVMFRDLIIDSTAETLPEILEQFRHWKNRRVYVADQPLIDYREL